MVCGNLAQPEVPTPHPGRHRRRPATADRRLRHRGIWDWWLRHRRVWPGRPSRSRARRFGGYGQQTAYANYQEIQKKKSPIGWWIGGAALVVAIIVIAVIAIRAIGGEIGVTGQPPAGLPRRTPARPRRRRRLTRTRTPMTAGCTADRSPIPGSAPLGGRRSLTTGCPSAATSRYQEVTVEPNYDGDGNSWVAVGAGRRAAGRRRLLHPGAGLADRGQVHPRRVLRQHPVQSDVKVNEATQVDGHEAWVVESQLSFDIRGSQDQGRAADRGDRLGRGAIGSVLRLDPGHPARAGAAGPRRAGEAAGRRE